MNFSYDFSKKKLQIKKNILCCCMSFEAHFSAQNLQSENSASAEELTF